jgi:hypothetical protein
MVNTLHLYSSFDVSVAGLYKTLAEPLQLLKQYDVILEM